MRRLQIDHLNLGTQEFHYQLENSSITENQIQLAAQEITNPYKSLQADQKLLTEFDQVFFI